jgi:hypothetical protein
MAIPIKTAVWIMGASLVAGCASAPADGLHPKNDLHCAIALWLTGQYAERTNAPAEKRRKLFVANSWYTQLVPKNAFETQEARDALAKAKEKPTAVEPVANACVDRAKRKTGFAGFQRRMGEIYDQADADRR